MNGQFVPQKILSATKSAIGQPLAIAGAGGEEELEITPAP